MAFYSGTVTADQLFQTVVDTITQVHAGATAAWWVKESSLESDGAFTSKGSSGTDRIVLALRPGAAGHYFIVGMARDYTPGAVNTAGAFDTLEIQNKYYFSALQSTSAQVTYNISVTPDRVIVHVQGDKLITGWQNTVSYIGIPTRYDALDTKCIVKGASENALHSNTLTVLEDSIGQVLQEYNWYYVSSPDNPSWGNNYFIETLHIGKVGEGLRAEIEGLYGSHDTGLVDGDVIDVSGTKFKVVKRNAYGWNSFPRSTLLIRMT